MNKIVIELCAEDRKRIDELIAFAGLIAGEMKARPAAVPGELLQAEVVVGLPVEGAAHLEPVVIEEDPAPAPAPEAKPISLGEFQKAIVTRCAESAAVKKKVQALVHKYAPSVSEIPEDKRSEFLAALAQI